MGRVKPGRGRRDPVAPGIVITPAPHDSAAAPGLCTVRWDDTLFVADADQVRDLARDLMAAASYADMIGVMTRDGFEHHVISALVTRMATAQPDGSTAPRTLGSTDTFLLNPTRAVNGRSGIVAVRRGAQLGELSADGAREMAQSWFAIAETAESDNLLVTALTEAGRFTDQQVADVLAYMSALRTDPGVLITGSTTAELRRALQDD